MFRDFSDSAKAKLLGYVEEVTKTSVWGKIGDAIGDTTVTVRSWFGYLNIDNYVDNLDEYHLKVIDKNDITAQQIEQIFTDVKNVDTRYGSGMAGIDDTTEKIALLIQELSSTINPSGGNLDMTTCSDLLQSRVEDMLESKAALQSTIESEMLGLNADGTELSADPVNLSTGNFVYDYEDMKIDGEIPLSFHRYYNSKDIRKGTLGNCYLHNYEVCVYEKAETVELRLADGRINYFEKKEDGTYIGKNSVLTTLTQAENGFVLTETGVEKIFFNQQGYMVRKEDMNGRGISFFYNDDMQLIKAQTDNGEYFAYKYNQDELMVEVADHMSRLVLLEYKNNRLHKVVSPSGATSVYEYGVNGRITEVVNNRNILAVKNVYDKNFRVTHQTFADGGTMSFEYNDKDRHVIMTERNGAKIIHVHDEKYRNIETIYHDGTKETYIYNDYNQCISKTDRNGYVTRMAYDSRGNLTQIIDPMRKRINYTYDSNNKLLCVSENGKQKIHNIYDAYGNLTESDNLQDGGVKLYYDNNSRVNKIEEKGGQQYLIKYDKKGNVLGVNTKKEPKILYKYDGLNRVISSCDANLNETKYQYDDNDNIKNVIDALGNERKYTYSKANKLETLIDFDGHQISFEYNNMGKISAVTDKEGNKTQYKYDKMWNIAKKIYPNGGVESFSFNLDNRMEEKELLNGGRTTYVYDANGNCIQEVDAEGKSRLYKYNKANQMIEKTDVDGGKVFYQYNKDGQISVEIDALGGQKQYKYDSVGRVSEVIDSLEQRVKITYNKIGKLECVLYPNESKQQYYYDLFGRLIKIDKAIGGTVEYTYDNNDNIIIEANSLGEKQYYVYDKLNRLISYENAMGGVCQYVYNAVGEIIKSIDENGNNTEYEYSPNGNLTKVISSLGDITTYEYDVMDKMIKMSQIGGEGELTQHTSYEWDPKGNLIKSTDPLGSVESYTYDLLGRMSSKLDRDGYTTNFHYGANNQLELVEYANNKNVKLSYNALHQLEKVKDWTGTTSYSYNKIGQLDNVLYPNGENVNFTWDSMGNRTSVVYPDGQYANYTYNQKNRLEKVSVDSREILYDYDDEGRVIRKKMPNNVQTVYQYNELGFIKQIEHRGKDIFESYKYMYDSSGNKRKVIKERNGLQEDSGQFDFDYDKLHRLIGVSKNGDILRKYTYDTFGNRVFKEEFADAESQQVQYVYNQSNQLVQKIQDSSDMKYTYDKRGNLNEVLEDNILIKNYEFDATNQMCRSTHILDNIKKIGNYEYNGLGQKVSQTISRMSPERPEEKISYTLDPTRPYRNLLQMKNESGLDENIQKFYWDNNVLGMEIQGHREQSEWNYYLQDDLGSPMAVMSDDEILTSYAFDEYGNSIYQSNEKYLKATQPFAFTGYEKGEVGDHYFAQARRYDAESGRFTSRDKVVGFAEKPISLNGYLYCWDNPLIYADLDGRILISTGLIVGSLIVGAITGVAAQGISDMISGNVSPIKKYVASAVGSASGAMVGTVVMAATGNVYLAKAAGAAVSSAQSTVISGIWDMADGTTEVSMENIIDLGATTVMNAAISAGLSVALSAATTKLTDFFQGLVNATGQGSIAQVSKMIDTNIAKGTWTFSSLSFKSWTKYISYEITKFVPKYTMSKVKELIQNFVSGEMDKLACA